MPARYRSDWEDLARVDPYWAILFDPARRATGWDLDEFLQTGETELAEVMAVAERLGLPEQRRRALDVGCGVGRITRPLSERFVEAYGADISPSMLAIARRLNGDRTACSFHLVGLDGRLPFEDGTFDLVFSSRVLQHLPDQAAIRDGIAELLRVLGPGGLLVVDLPSSISLRRRLQPRRRAYALLRTLGIRAEVLLRGRRLTPLRMLAMSEPEMAEAVGAHGGTILEVVTPPAPAAGIRITTYFVIAQATSTRSRPRRLAR